MALGPHNFPTEISHKQDNYSFLGQKYMNCLELKIVVFTLINRLSQQKLNASFSASDFFVLGETPVALDYVHYFQPALNFLYLGIICPVWATACLVSIEMAHLSLVFMLHFRHADTEVRASLPWNIGSRWDEMQTRFANDLCSQWTKWARGDVERDPHHSSDSYGSNVLLCLSVAHGWTGHKWMLPQRWIWRALRLWQCCMEVMFLFTCSW